MERTPAEVYRLRRPSRSAQFAQRDYGG